MEQLPGTDINIALTTAPADLEWCARLMAANEPWITLQRGYEDSLRLLLEPISDVYVLTRDHERIGFVVIKLKGSFTGYIQCVAIDRPFRRQGIGKIAIRYIESLIFRTSPNVFVCVSSFNSDARRLYQKIGYETIGVLRDYIVAGHDEILMRKTSGPLQEFAIKS
ncbi:MAG: GNAT family N-acetyltransferase [Chitinophagaceae bacterium]|nr:GNAT family N-acetyltransferase [Chitinophagaceae bacterium]